MCRPSAVVQACFDTCMLEVGQGHAMPCAAVGPLPSQRCAVLFEHLSQSSGWVTVMFR